MLKRLYIKNFAIISELTINFENGFNVITGETGAGKSIIVESLAFLFGSRLAFKDMKDDVYVSAIFIKDETDYLIERVYDRDGRSKYFLNKKNVPYYEIEKLKKELIDFHSQMENTAIVDKDYQISLIDKYLKIEEDVKRYNRLFDERKELLSKLNALSMSENERQKMIEILKFQIDEIENANLKIDEDIALQEKIANYKNKSKVISAVDLIDNLFYEEGGIFELLVKSRKKVQELNEIGDFSDLVSKVDIIYDHLNEFKDILKEKKSLYDFEEDIDKLIDRDNLIKRLKKKYNVLSISELISLLESFKKELENLSSLSSNLDAIRNRLSEVENQMENISNYLSKRRKEGVKKLSKSILSVLKDLDFKDARFEIAIESTEEYLPNGKDRVEFLFSSIPDFPLKPIRYVVSGGEISRIMVALKYIFSGIEKPSTMILDEIDTGTGGNTAFKIGKIIKEIAKTTQVLCITHLPQIAVFADNHIKVEKRVDLNKTVVEARVMNDESQRINEIARMFGSEYSLQTATKHAMELLKRCKAV